MTSIATDTKRSAYIAGLRAIAAALEADPELVLPHDGSDAEYSRVAVFTQSKEQLLAWSAVLGGKRDKEIDPDSQSYGFQLLGSIEGIHIRVYAPREEVCTARVVGTETITTKMPVAYEDVEITRDIVEWDCHPLLTGDSPAAEQARAFASYEPVDVTA